MKQIPNSSVDMVLCDLPYGCLDLEWDQRIDGKRLFQEYKRICKQNANVLLFCQIEFAKYLMDSTFASEFSHCLIWIKNNKTRCKSAKKLPMSQYEMVLCFRLNKYSNRGNHKALRDYFMKELEKSGYTVKQIKEMIPNYSAHHYFTYQNDFRLPTELSYRRLQEITGCFPRPYESIKQEFLQEKRNLCVYNPGFLESDCMYASLEEQRVHPTQKPVSLLEKLILAYSNPGDTVLDNTMGSGSTGVACVNTGRSFIGMELDANCFDIAKERINAAEKNSLMQQNMPQTENYYESLI
ncbi:MAG: site-specific DNA-methyltransferase [Oscillospiraceae bacterium]|nr:site-specific DNA-methyltransferase [Oscillospiraceae bacterium]